MAQNRKKVEPEETAGAPEWMVTFSDCMTLLLTFFVLLLSFSSFDDAAMSRVQKSIGMGMPAKASITGNMNTSLAEIKTIKKVDIITEGSKTPTPTDIALGNIAKQPRLTDYQRQKVFSIDSDKIFVGKSSDVINPKNKQILDNMTVFLKAKPSRVVVSEFDPKTPDHSDKLGLNRAWAIMNYFVKSNIDASNFSITGSSMLTRNDNIDKRQIVITLLEEDVYK
ncbi:MAG: hypothetical protein K9M75_06415 [Phycisphaerae bacterium]|nr:hypothetical protein [Phycisphaerae bacterium]